MSEFALFNRVFWMFGRRDQTSAFLDFARPRSMSRNHRRCVFGPGSLGTRRSSSRRYSRRLRAIAFWVRQFRRVMFGLVCAFMVSLYCGYKVDASIHISVVSMYRNGMRVRWNAEDNTYIATHPDAPGCLVFGQTEEEAMRELEVAMQAIYGVCIEEGLPAPQPAKIAR